VDLSGIRGDLTQRSRKVRQRILQWIGIPCGIGIGPTKTLAKLANHIAKTAERKPGSYPDQNAQVCNLAHLPKGTGRLMLPPRWVKSGGWAESIGAQLKEAGIQTVLDLARLDPAMVKRRWSVVLERTVRELQGTDCIGLEMTSHPKQEIACTRSFGPCGAGLGRASRSGDRVCQPGCAEIAAAKRPCRTGADIHPHQPLSHARPAVFALNGGAAQAIHQ
jgi:DNA polymerase V